MSAPAILAKAVFDNLADSPDELSFRRGDIVTVLEQDIDGLIGWWLCSLHGRQGIAPGNRLQEIKRRADEEVQAQSPEVFTFEDVDYDVPRSQEGVEDYAVPRGITSPDYDIPNGNQLQDYAVPKGFIEPSSGEEIDESQQLYDVPLNTSSDKEIIKRNLADTDPNNSEIPADIYNVPMACHKESMPPVMYKVPANGADVDQDTVQLSNQDEDFASLDQTVDTGELYDIPSSQESSREMDGKQALKVHDDQEIYTEIYDIPAVQAEQENTGCFERLSQETHGLVDMHSAELKKLGKPADGLARLSTASSDGKRRSTSSTDSAKLSCEDDDYVDYQEIYGDGKEKEVNVYDVPVQPIPLSQEKDIRNSPTTKRTQVSILQRINMTAVKEIKLDPAVALQRLTKLEKAVDGTVQKLLSFVTTTWRNPSILKSQLADIRDISGKAKVALRLLTEFALSSLVNARSLPTQELSGKLSRAIEPLLETYYSVKLALQRLDDQDWRTPLEKSNNTHDELDLIMVHIRSVPENSHKLASIIRTGATSLYKTSGKMKEELASQQPSTVGQSKMPKVVKQPEKVDAPDLMDASSNDTTVSLITSTIKDTVDANFKPKADGTRWSPTTVRRVCGMDHPKRNSNGFTVNGRVKYSEEDSVPKLPSRLQSSVDQEKDAMSGEGLRSRPPPPQRKDSGEKCHHLRQRSIEKFPTDGASNDMSGPPPKPKLDRKKTSRKSYKIPLFSEQKYEQEEVVRREHKGSETDMSTPRRKCNSDPTQLKDHKNTEMSSTEQTHELHHVAELRKQSSVHVSDSDLPQSLRQLNTVQSLASQFEKQGSVSSPHHNLVDDVLQHRPLSNLIQDGGVTNGFMVSLNDRELLEFYKYEIDAQLFVLSEAIKGFFAVVDKNESPKVFVSNSKFVVLSAHKFVYIGDTLTKKIKHSDLRSTVITVTNKLSNSIKLLVSATKSAALQFPASNAMREMSDSVLLVNDTAIELYQIVKKTTKSTL